MGAYLSTVDNKYDPTIDFDAWQNEDDRLGHDCNGKLARIATMFYGWNDKMPDEKQLAIIENAIDDIVEYDFLGLYCKIKKE